jgi:hypothetical protein
MAAVYIIEEIDAANQSIALSNEIKTALTFYSALKSFISFRAGHAPFPPY